MLVDRLNSILNERTEKNPAYSLRAFARSLGVDSSTLSAILRKKRPVTFRMAKKLVNGLGIIDSTEAQFLIMSTVHPEATQEENQYAEMSLDVAEAISGWEHFAILALLELPNFQGRVDTISVRLNISVQVAADCLDRLEKLGLAQKDRDENWVVTGRNMATPSGVPSASIREGHKQFIERAVQSLDEDAVNDRDISGITMAISKKNLEPARNLIKEFRLRMASFLEQGSKDSVYRLNVQLYPLALPEEDLS